MTDKIAIFIDGANLRQAAKRLGMYIDFEKLVARILKEYPESSRLIRTYYYTAVDDEVGSVRNLVTWLSTNGFHVVSKPVKIFYDERGRPTVKGNMDIELAVDMMKAAKYLNYAVLVSGDGDFRRLVSTIQDEGVHVTVVSSTIGGTCSTELRMQADQYLDINDIRHEIEQDRQRYQREPDPGLDSGSDSHSVSVSEPEQLEPL